MSDRELEFACMGSQARIVLRDARTADLAAARSWLEDFDARLSRFRPDSELCALNADPRAEAPASALLRAAVGAGLWAARRSGGLVDPTLLEELERAGYRESLAGATPLSLAQALGAAPPRRPAAPGPRSRWREVVVDEARGTIRRPCGVRIDTGGVGKGLAADALAHRLSGHPRFAIDCGGDVRVGGADALAEPFDVEVIHPLTGDTAHALRLGRGAIASSGMDVRVWRRPDGSVAHHLLDPATGEPAWTGLVSVTALAPSALEAETLSKLAFLSGPVRASRMLARHGGVLVHDDGEVEPVGVLGSWEPLAA